MNAACPTCFHPARCALLRVLSLVTLSLVLPLQQARAQDTAQQVDRIMAGLDGPHTPGALVGIVRDGELVLARAYGMADLTHDVPFTLETRTNIGSTAKQFTAFGVLLLAQQGRLSLDDDVRSHLPELPEFGETITLRHLLTHTSGYREFINALAIGGWRIEDADHIPREEIVRVVQRQPELQNSPGAEWNYNNTGYGLLATVIERVTGESFPAWLAAHVFRPLGMDSTLVRADTRQIVKRGARGYTPVADGFREAGDIGAAMGAGGVYTTLGDMARWLRNLRTGAYGGAELIAQMTTPYVLTTGDTTQYGLGLMIGADRGLRIVQHGGGDLAHRSHFAWYPEHDVGVIVLTNNAAMPPTIPSRVTEVFLGEHMTPREAADAAAAPALVETDPLALDDLAGRYELAVAPGFVLTIRRADSGLTIQATGQPEFPLVATSDSTFALTVVEASITFHRDAEGSVTGLTLHQAGNHAARRLPEDTAPPPDLAAYVGRYYSSELDTSYDVRLEDGALVLRHRRRPPAALTHARDDAFSGAFPLVSVAFEREAASGAVVAFRASNGRARDIRFERVP